MDARLASTFAESTIGFSTTRPSIMSACVPNTYGWPRADAIRSSALVRSRPAFEFSVGRNCGWRARSRAHRIKRPPGSRTQPRLRRPCTRGSRTHCADLPRGNRPRKSQSTTSRRTRGRPVALLTNGVQLRLKEMNASEASFTSHPSSETLA